MDFYEPLFTENLAFSQSENIFIPHDFSATRQTSLVGQVFDFVVEYLAHASFSCDSLQELFNLFISSRHLCPYAFSYLEFSLSYYVKFFISLAFFNNKLTFDRFLVNFGHISSQLLFRVDLRPTFEEMKVAKESYFLLNQALLDLLKSCLEIFLLEYHEVRVSN